MAEQFDPQETPESEPTKTALRSRARRLVTPLAASQTPAVRPTRAQRRAAGKSHPMRSLVTVAAVAALVGTVAVPAAFAATGSAVPAEAAVTTLQQVAADNSQSIVVAS